MFQGKNIIITGGSSGIGKGLALRLGREGANLALVARDPEKLSRAREEVASGCPGPDPKVKIYSCDISDAEKVEETMQEIVKDLGPPDILVNSAGILLGEYFENQSLSDFHSLMDTNFYGTLHFIRAALPHLKRKGGGHIINVSSVAGVIGVFGYTSYCSSKYAVVGLSGALRAELKPQGVSVHLVLPPETETPMLDQVNQSRPIENKMVASTAGVLSVDQVVEAVIKGLKKGRYLIVPGLVTRLLLRMGQLLPFMERLIVDLTIKRYYRGPGPSPGKL